MEKKILDYLYDRAAQLEMIADAVLPAQPSINDRYDLVKLLYQMVSDGKLDRSDQGYFSIRAAWQKGNDNG